MLENNEESLEKQDTPSLKTDNIFKELS